MLRRHLESLEDRVVPAAGLSEYDRGLTPHLSALGNVSTMVSPPSFAAAVTDQTATRQVVFVDSAVPNSADLLAGISRSRPAGTEVVGLDPRLDGVRQITDFLQRYHGLDSVQIVSHGAPGAILLGDTVLDDARLAEDRDQVAAWGRSLQPDGDVILYGCDVAEGAGGERFVQDLARDTGAAVAASTDRTGGTALGGDWNLEYRTGPIQAAPVLTAAADAAYRGVLAFDLPTYIQNMLAGHSASFTVNEPVIDSATLGNALQLNGVKLTGTATLTSGVWSGSVTVSVDSATIFPGGAFTAAVTPAAAGQPAVTGTYTIGGGYALTAAKVSLSVGEALTVAATNVNLAYNPNAAGEQTLASNVSATATSGQFAGLPSAALTNFSLRTDGFQFGAFTLNSAAGTTPSIGNFLKASSVALTVSAFNATFGPSVATPTLTGTVGVAVTGLQLFPTGNFVQLQSSAVTAAYNFGTFDGTTPTGKLTVTVSGFHLAMGEALDLSAGTTDVVLTPGQDTLATIPALTLSSPKFAGLGTVAVGNLQITQSGFTVGSLSWGTTAPVSVGNGILTASALSVNLSNFALGYATPATETTTWAANSAITFQHGLADPTSVLVTSTPAGGGTTTLVKGADYTLVPNGSGNLQVQFVSGRTPAVGAAVSTSYKYATVGGSVVFTGNNVALFPNVPVLNLRLGTLTGGFDFGGAVPGLMKVHVGDLRVPLGDALSLNLGAIDLTPGLSTMLHAVNVSVTANLLAGFPPISLASFDLLQTGFTLGTFSLSTPNELTVGDFLSITGPSSIAVNGFAVNTATNTITGSITASLGAVTLFPGNAAVTSTFTGLTGAFDFSSSATPPGRLKLHADGFSLSLFGQLNVAASDVTFTPGLDTLVTIPDATATFAPLDGLAVAVHGVAVTRTGFTVASGSAGFTALTLGGVVALTAPTVTASNLAYTFHGALTGTVGFSASTAALHLGSALDASVGTTTGSYDLAGKELSLALSTLAANVAGFAAVGATSAVLSYAPAVDGSAKVLVGATGVTGFLGLPAGGGQEAVGVQLSGGKLGLAVLKSPAGVLTYALDALGGVALTGVPTGTVSFTSSVVEFRKNTAGRVHEVIDTDGTPAGDFHLNFAQNEESAAGSGMSLSVGAFVTVSGDFGFKKFTDGTGTDVAIVANNVHAAVTAGTVGLTVDGASLGLILKPGATGAATTYALVVNGGADALTGVPGLTLTADGLTVRVRKGLDVSTITGLPAALATPPVARTATEPLTVTGTTSAAFQYLPTDLTTVVVTATKAGATTTLVAGTDYDLEPAGTTARVRFTGHAPAAGETFAAAYGYETAQSVALDFSGLGSGSADVTDVEGHTTIAVAGFASLAGDFGFQKFTPTTGPATFAVGAMNVTATLGTADTNVTVTNGTLGLLAQGGNYALLATAGGIRLNGVTGLTLSASSVAVKVRRGLDVTTVGGVPVVHTSGGDVTLDFTGLGTADVTSIQGNVTLAVAGFGSLAGDFGFQAYQDGATGAKQIAVGAKNLSVVVGTADTNLTVANASFGLIVRPGNGTTVPTTYALEARGSSNPADTSLNGVPGLTLTASNLLVRVRKGLDVTTASGFPTTIQTSAGDVTPDFTGLGAGTTDVTDVQGVVSLAVADFVTINGRFGFQRYVSGADSYFAFGLDGGVTLAAGSNQVTLSDTTISALVKKSGTSPATFALQAATGGDVVFSGPTGLTFGASGLKVRVKRGLDVSTYPAGVPTTVLLPAVTAVAPAEATVATGTTTSIALTHALADASTVVVTSTPSGGTTATTLVRGTDYTLGLDSQGRVTVNFPAGHVPAANATIRITYAYQSQPAETVAFDFGDLGAGTADVTDLQGHGSFAVAGFASLEGDFGFQKYGTGAAATLVVGGTNLNAVLGTADTNVSVAGASFGLMTQGANYALVTNGGTLALNGVTGLSLSATGLHVKVRKGMGAVAGAPSVVHTPGGDVTLDFSSLPAAADVTAIDGHVALNIADFVDVAGDFRFTKTVAGTVTKILVGASGVNAFVGTAAHDLGVQIANTSLGLVILRDSTKTGSTYALQASAPAITLVGLPSEVQLTGSAAVNINTTGAAVNEMAGTSSPVVFATGANVKSFGGSLTLAVGSAFTLTGDFSLSKVVAGNVTKLIVGAANVGTPTGTPVTPDGGTATYSLSDGTLGLVFYKNTATNTSLGYALSASARAAATAGGVAAAATIGIRRNTTTTAQNDAVTVGAATVPLVFTAAEVQTGTTAFQKIVLSDASLSIDNSLIITANQGTTSTPTANASSTTLTGVTLTLQDPPTAGNGNVTTVLFTIAAGTAAYTTFSGAVTPAAAAAAGLRARADGQSWAAGDKLLVLRNVSFTIGTYVSFSAVEIDVQHYTAGTTTVNKFVFTDATIALLDAGKPMASLTGDAKFSFTTGAATAAQNGFNMESFTPNGFSFLDQTAELAATSPPPGSPPASPPPGSPPASPPAAVPRRLGPLTLVGPTVGLSNFKFDMTGRLTAQVSIGATSATIGAGPIAATFTAVSGTFDVGLTFDLAHLTAPPTNPSVAFNNIKALGTGTGANRVPGLSVKLGNYVTLAADSITLKPDAAANQDLFSVTSLTAALDAGSVHVAGTASNFAIEGDGSFLAKTGFAVGVTVTDATQLGFPAFFPLTSLSVALKWADFNAHPDQFLVQLSAAVGDIGGLGLTVNGSITNVVIDPQLLAAGSFPIISIDSAAVSVSGNLFAAAVSGTLIFGIVRFDATGAVVDGLGNLTGTTTPGTGPFTSAFYTGIAASLTLGGSMTFAARIGISQFGLLEIYLEAGVPVPLGPTGLFLSDFRGGVRFDATFPTVTVSSPAQADDALQLRKPGFSTPDKLTAAQWEAQLRAQVAKKYHDNPNATFATPPSSAVIQAGATVYAANKNAFRIDGDLLIDTTGKFLILGTGVFGNNLSIGVKVYTDLSGVFAGTSTTANVLFLMENPSQAAAPVLPPVYSVFGVATFADTAQGFSISVGGAVEYNALNALKARVQATITLTFSSDRFNITLSGGQFFIPTLQTASLAQAAGTLTVQTDAQGNVGVWGAFLLTAPTPTFLTNLGITVGGQIFARVNTTGDVKHVTLDAGNATYPLDLPAQSFSLLVHGYGDFAISGTRVFELNGDLALEINPEHLTLFVQAQLLLGNDPTHPVMTFNANGLVYVGFKDTTTDHRGFAAKLTLTTGATLPAGITFGTNWLLVVNTTLNDITYTIPDPVQTNPPTQPVATVMGPDYTNASNPLALTSYELVTGGVRTLVIPRGAPSDTLSNYKTWTSATANTYFLVLGRGNATIANTITLTGNLNVVATVAGGSVSFKLAANTKLAVKLNGNTVFQFDVVGGVAISNAGVAAVVRTSLSSGFALPAGLGFGLSAAYLLELNTTGSAVTIGTVTIPGTQKVLIHGDGHLTLLGSVVDLAGGFDISISSTSLAVGVNANVTLLGATFHADGSAAIYYDAHPGLALRIGLSLPGGAQGTAPISAIGNNFVISGAFRLELNTTGVTRQDLNNNAIASGFKVAVDNLGVYLYGFNLNGSISVALSTAGVDFDVNLTLNFFGVASINVTGYYHHDGAFRFTGTAGFQFGDHTFGIGGSLSLTVASNGFGIAVSGWAAAFGIEISAGGSVVITGTSVDITVRFQVTIVPAINIDTPDVDMGLFTIPGIHIHTAAVVVGKDATYHLGSISQPPVVAPVTPPIPPPTPPHLAGVTSGVLKLFLGDDVGQRVNDTGVATGAQTDEEYGLRLDPNDTNPNDGQDIIVTALGLDQEYRNVTSIVVSGTGAANATIFIDNAIVEPVRITLGSGNNTITTGGGLATVVISGGGGNAVTTADGATVTVAAGATGSNQINVGNNAAVTINSVGTGLNQVTLGTGATVVVNGNENNQVNAGGTSAAGVTVNGTGNNTITVSGGPAVVTLSAAATGNNAVTANSTSAATVSVAGGGINTVASVGTGSATITVTGNGDNQVTAAGPATITLSGGGNNQVGTGAGAASVYDYGAGSNTVSGGAGGGTFYYGLNGPNGSPYSVKGTSTLTSAAGNFAVDARGYGAYQLSDYGLVSGTGTRTLNLVGVRSATLSAAAAGTNTFTLVGWSGNATLNGVGGNNTLTTAPKAGVGGVAETLSDTALRVTGGVVQTITLNGIQTANLVGSAAAGSANSFDVSGWTGGGSLTGSKSTTNTATAANDVALFTLSDGFLKRTGRGDLTLTRVQTANLTGGAGANTFAVSGWSGTTTLAGLNAGDTYNLTLSGSGTGTFNVTDTGTAGTDTLNVTGSATTLVTGSGVRVGTQQVNYGPSGIEVLNVTGGTTGLTYNVQGTSSAAATTVNARGNANTVNVGSAAGVLPAAAGTLAGIRGGLTVAGEANTTGNTLNVDDRATTANETGTLTGTTISGLTLGGPIAYGNMQALNLYTGGGGDTLTMTGIAPATLTTVSGSTGADTFAGNFPGSFLGTLIVQAFETIGMAVHGDFTGGMLATGPGAVQTLSIDGSETAGSQIRADVIWTGVVGQDVAGLIKASQSVVDLTVRGSVAAPGVIQTGLDVATLRVTGDVAGQVQAGQHIGLLTTGGSVSGLVTAGGDIYTLAVGRDVSGTVRAAGVFGQASVGGSVTPTGVLTAAAAAGVSVGQDLAGHVTTTFSNISVVSVGRAITYQGVVTVAGNLPTATVGPNQLVVGDDMAGQVVVAGDLLDLRVAGGTPGTVAAGRVGTVRTFGGFGPFVAQVKEAGVQRNVAASAAGADYPIPTAVPTNVTPVPSPASYVNVQYLYEGTAGGLASPQLSARITNPVSTRPDQYDLSLVAYGDTPKFNLARVVAAGVTGVRNVAVEGDLLKTITPAAQAFIGQATAAGGVMLPMDDVAGVAVRDLAVPGTIQAKSIQALAFGSTLRGTNQTVTGSLMSATDAKNLLVAGTTPIVLGGSTNGTGTETYRVPFTGSATQKVAFFLSTGQYAKAFDTANILFTAQSPNAQRPNAVRGAVTALIGVADGSYPYTPAAVNAIVQTVALRGDGGSLASALWVAKSITSTGPLGDVAMNHVNGVTDITAPAVFGNLTSYGPLTGTVQTTGVRTDPITGAATTVPADFGRAYTTAGPYGTPIVTSTAVTFQRAGSMTVPGVAPSALMGRLIVRGNLLSKLTATGGISGTIAVQGDVGASSTLLSTTSPTRVGGISTSSLLTGRITALGRSIGDVSLLGGIGAGGSVAVAGDVVGNLATYAIAAGGSVVVGGAIGSAALGTGLSFTSNQGIIAATNAIIKKGTTATTPGYYVSSAATVPDGIDAAVIRTIYAGPTGTPLTSLDSITAGDLGGLTALAAKLGRLRVLNCRLTVV